MAGRKAAPKKSAKKASKRGTKAGAKSGAKPTRNAAPKKPQKRAAQAPSRGRRWGLWAGGALACLCLGLGVWLLLPRAIPSLCPDAGLLAARADAIACDGRGRFGGVYTLTARGGADGFAHLVARLRARYGPFEDEAWSGKAWVEFDLGQGAQISVMHRDGQIILAKYVY